MQTEDEDATSSEDEKDISWDHCKSLCKNWQSKEGSGLAALTGLLNSSPQYVVLSSATGKTLLHWAAYGGYLEAIELLLQRGASKEAVDICGRTPLGMAQLSGQGQEITLTLSP
jgi:ankyrin repeat protein